MLDHLCSGSERSRGPKLIDYGTGRKCCPRVDRLDPAKIPCGRFPSCPKRVFTGGRRLQSQRGHVRDSYSLNAR